MRNLALAFIAFIAAVTVISCDDTETYAEQKDKERAAISRFIADSAITVITESQFKEQGYKTDVSKNEFVLMQNSGVYMQIVREGCGEKIKEGETTTMKYSYKLPEPWNADNIAVVAFVYNDNGVENVAKKHLVEHEGETEK